MAKIKIVGETPGRYTKVFNSIIRSPFLTPAEKATYLYLVSMPPEASVSHSDIASAVGVSRNSASTYVASLEQKGVLTSRRHGTASRSYISQYTIRVNPDDWMCQNNGQITEDEEPKTLDHDLTHSAKISSTNVPKSRACIEDYVYKKDMKTNSFSRSSENSGKTESSSHTETSEEFQTAWDSLTGYPRVGNLSTCKEIYSRLVREGNDPQDIAKGVSEEAKSFEGDEQFRPGLKRILESGQWKKGLVEAKQYEEKKSDTAERWAWIDQAAKRQIEETKNVRI